jgi:hypothetical protein
MTIAEEIAALRADLMNFRDHEFAPMAVRNDTAHDEIKKEVARINGDLRDLKLWRADFLGQLKGAAGGGRALWAVVAMVAGPVTALTMRLLER